MTRYSKILGYRTKNEVYCSNCWPYYKEPDEEFTIIYVDELGDDILFCDGCSSEIGEYDISTQYEDLDY